MIQTQKKRFSNEYTVLFAINHLFNEFFSFAALSALSPDDEKEKSPTE